MTQPSKTESPQSDAALKDLAPLVGEWTMLGRHPQYSTAVSGHSSFKWLEHGALLVWRFEWEPQGPPNAISVIGHDDSVGTYTMLYSDVRGVARIYQISLAGRVWKMWREAPNFSQRLTGVFSDDGHTITSRGELQRDGTNWARDLDVTYTKVS